jgi:hypothetical protein
LGLIFIQVTLGLNFIQVTLGLNFIQVTLGLNFIQVTLGHIDLYVKRVIILNDNKNHSQLENMPRPCYWPPSFISKIFNDRDALTRTK